MVLAIYVHVHVVVFIDSAVVITVVWIYSQIIDSGCGHSPFAIMFDEERE